ncbi:hypothetical protein FB567DRAFT_550357 [Paraphoma chrysanthemicola]|uniref:Uncharacterized protein n=1 Tax=Paraphoma chrysanthemicola TaxID=798071 RepID=A0A8K0R2U5_9PLEO|nr:hypothetical protein FB567DRAFT_550357 [Paraphoma chrysanthemicola]
MTASSAYEMRFASSGRCHASTRQKVRHSEFWYRRRHPEDDEWRLANGDAYGEGSFITHFVEDCVVFITKWHLRARACRLQGNDAKAQDQAFKRACEIIEGRGTAKEVSLAKISREFLRDKQNIVIQPAFAEIPFITAGEALSFILTPLHARDSATRRSFWKDQLNGDVWASFFGKVTSVVDLLAMRKDPLFVTMWRH